MIDVSAVMGGDRSPLEVLIQMPGEAYAMATSEVALMADESRDFRRLLLGIAS